MNCPRCGAQNPEGSTRCWQCGFEWAVVPPPAPESAVATIIPYKNTSALIAYYLGVFSIVCGPVLGVPAIILGILGLQFATKHPEAKGKAHAWVGIVLGGLMTLVTAGAILFFLVMAGRR